MYVTAFNPGDSPVLVSVDGRVIGGHEWGVVETTDDEGKHVLEHGFVIKWNVPEDRSGIAVKQAKDSVEDTEKRNEYLEAGQKVDHAILLEDARKNGYVQEDEKPNKSELVRLYTEKGYDLPKTPAAKKTTAAQPESKEG